MQCTDAHRQNRLSTVLISSGRCLENCGRKKKIDEQTRVCVKKQKHSGTRSQKWPVFRAPPERLWGAAVNFVLFKLGSHAAFFISFILQEAIVQGDGTRYSTGLFYHSFFFSSFGLSFLSGQLKPRILTLGCKQRAKYTGLEVSFLFFLKFALSCSTEVQDDNNDPMTNTHFYTTIQVIASCHMYLFIYFSNSRSSPVWCCRPSDG